VFHITPSRKNNEAEDLHMAKGLAGLLKCVWPMLSVEEKVVGYTFLSYQFDGSESLASPRRFAQPNLVQASLGQDFSAIFSDYGCPGFVTKRCELLVPASPVRIYNIGLQAYSILESSPSDYQLYIISVCNLVSLIFSI